METRDPGCRVKRCREELVITMRFLGQMVTYPLVFSLIAVGYEPFTSFEYFKYLVWSGLAVSMFINMYNDFWGYAETKYFITAWETDTALWGWIIGTVIIYYLVYYFLKETGLWIIGIIGWLYLFNNLVNWWRTRE